MQFSNLKELLKYSKRVTRYPLEQVAIKIQDILKDYILREWYNREGFSPTSYSRSYEFINCLDITPIKETPNGYGVEIFFNTDKMNSVDRSQYGEWHQHMSQVDGSDVRESIPYYIEYGNNSSLYNYEGIHMVENTIEYCKQNKIPIKEMIMELKKYGFNVNKV